MLKQLRKVFLVLSLSLFFLSISFRAHATLELPPGYTAQSNPGMGNQPSGHMINPPPPPVNTLPQSGIFVGGCQGINFGICGTTVPLPETQLGSIVSANTPNPYVHQSFTARCAILNGVPVFQAVDVSAVTCTLQTCVPSTTNICGLPFSIPVGLPAGSSLPLTIPDNAVNQPTHDFPLTLNATCVAGDGPTALYQVDTSAISCNIFRCQDAKIPLCNMDVPVSGGAKLGSIIQINMPPPYQPDPFSVQCLGTEGKAPTYKLIDHSAVSCAPLVLKP